MLLVFDLFNLGLGTRQQIDAESIHQIEKRWS